jgi:hypothetical protein
MYSVELLDWLSDFAEFGCLMLIETEFLKQLLNNYSDVCSDCNIPGCDIM